MADISDIEVSLVAVLADYFSANASYLSGSSTSARVFRGRPKPYLTNIDRSSQTVEISVLSSDARCEILPTWLSPGFTVRRTSGLSVTAGSSFITINGVANEGDEVGLSVFSKTFAVTLQGGESAEFVAAKLFQALSSIVSCNLLHNTLQFPITCDPSIVTFGAATVLRELSRQRQSFDITIYTSSAVMRDMIGAAITTLLDSTPFLALSDGSMARLLYEATSADDKDTPASVFKRVLRYSAAFSTFAAQPSAAMMFGAVKYNDVMT